MKVMRGWEIDRMLRELTTIESSAATEFQRELSDNMHLEWHCTADAAITAAESDSDSGSQLSWTSKVLSWANILTASHLRDILTAARIRWKETRSETQKFRTEISSNRKTYILRTICELLKHCLQQKSKTYNLKIN